VTREPRDPFSVLRTVSPAAVGIDRPLQVAVGADGHVFVTDRGQTVTELTDTGQVVRRWGGPGTGPGRFRLYSGALAVGPDGDVYVADTGNFRIQVFAPDGTFVAEYGGYGQGPAQFVWPSGIVVGDDGTMYVADDRAATVTALSPSGRQLWRRGTPAETDPDLVGHEHLGGVDAAGELVTANDDAGKVLYLDSAGDVVDAFSTDAAGADVDARGIPGGHFPNGACGATLDPRGDVYVNSCEESYEPRHDTAVYDPAHRLVAGWKRGDLVDSPVFGPSGRAWAVTSGDHALVELAVHLPDDQVTGG
jgi:streptogramin lyase